MALAGPEDPTSVATQVQNCLDGFQNACNSMSKAELHIKRKLPPGLINDELGRFSIWSGNVGAHRRGKGSLDYKLREASHIRDRVLELLQNLRSVLQEAIDIITGERVAWEDLSDSDSDMSDDGLQRIEEQPTTELAQLASNMAEINTCLMRLSMAIRNPAPHDQFKKSTHIDVAHFETFDIDHVRGKFPVAKEYLVVRLGKAISRRRQYLRYREEHRKKLEQGLKQLPQQEVVVVPQSTPCTVTAPSEKIESTVASSIPTVAKESASAAAFDENDYYEDALSQTSYASSTNSVARLRPPQLPDAGLHGDPFECPLCFRFTSVRQTATWHKHVYRDLQPYVCTSEECEIPDRTYESRHEWFHHESQVHRKYWECVEGCNRHFQSSETLHAHLSHDHSNLTTEDRIDDLIRSCERHDGMTTSAECPLCQLQLPSLSLLRRHLGKHHEELSLFALPSHMKEEHEDSEDEEKGDGSRSLPSVAADGRSLSPFLDAGDELGDSNDDNENRLETVSQPSTSGSSLSSHSSTPAILYCISGDCEAKFDGKHRRIDLARHLRYTHGRSSTYHCEDPDCNRRFYEEDTRLKHYRKHHPTLAHNRSISTSALSIDGYLDKLVAYYRERGIVIDVDRREFVVGERTVTLRDIRKAMEGQGGYHPFTTNYAWAELGRELGQSTRLTSDGVDQAKKIYSEYLQPFDEYLQRGGGEIAHVPTNSSEPSAIPLEEKKPLKVQISGVSATSSASRFSLRSPGMIELAEKEVRYFPDDSPERCRLPVAEITSIQVMEYNSLEIIGGLYKYDISLWERSEGVTTIVLEFPNIENRDYTHDCIQYMMVQSALDQNPDEEQNILLLYSHFLASRKDQSLLEPQIDTTGVKTQDEAQSLPVVPSKEQTGFYMAQFIIHDGTNEAEVYMVTIVANQRDLIIMNKNNLSRRWQISRDTISDIVLVSSSKVCFMAELREGNTMTKLRLAVVAQSRGFVEIVKVLQGSANNDAAGDNGMPKDEESADAEENTAAEQRRRSHRLSMTQAQVDEQRRLLAAEGLHMQREIEAQIESKSDVLDTSHMNTSAESAPRKDNTESKEQTAEQSGSPNSSSQESGTKITRKVQDLEDKYPPTPENHEFGIKLHILQDGSIISRYSDISLRSTYLRIGIDDLGQVWYIYYKNVTIISESEDIIDLRSILWRISAEAINGESSKSEFSIKPATSSQMTELLHRLREKGVTFQPHMDKSKAVAPAPSSPAEEKRQGSLVGATLFSTLATVNIRGLYNVEGTLSLDLEGLVAEDHSAFQHWRFEYKNMSRIAISGRGICFRDTLNALHTDPPGIAIKDVMIAPSPPENVERIVALLREHVSDGAISISSDTDQTLQDHRLTLQALEKLRGSREGDIIRRCEQADPPIPPESLHRLNGFKEAVASKEPITAMAFELLLPRLRAELELADESISFLISSNEESSEEEDQAGETEFVHEPTSRDLESPRGPPYLVNASIFRHRRYTSNHRTERLRTVRLEFFQTFFQLKKDGRRWGMQHQHIKKCFGQETTIFIQGMGQNVSQMENLHGLAEDSDLLVTISTASAQDTEAILNHLKVFEDMKTQAELESLRGLRDYVSSQSESESESESKAPIDPESPARKASTEDPVAFDPHRDRYRKSTDFGTVYSSETEPIPMELKPEINETLDQPVDGSKSSQRIAEQGPDRQTPNVYGEPSEEVDESSDDDSDEYDDDSVYISDSDEYEPTLADDQRQLLTAQETASSQQARSTKLKAEAEEEEVKGAADALNAYSKLSGTDSDHEDETTPLERALRQTRQSGQMPGDVLKRLTAAAAEDDDEVNTSVEKDNEPPHKYQCVFWFFDCNHVSSNKLDWISHSLSHFGGRLPPPLVRCPICRAPFTDLTWVDREAWIKCLNHLIVMHWDMIERLSEIGLVDPDLLRHLEMEGVISEEELERMKNGEQFMPKTERLRYGMPVDVDDGEHDSGVKEVVHEKPRSSIQPSLETKRDNEDDSDP